MWHMGDGWGWWMMLGWVWMVVFWGLIIWAVYRLVTRLDGRETAPQSRAAEPTAMEILERRYARGELGDDEFEAMQGRLGGRAAPDAVASPAGRNGGAG